VEVISMRGYARVLAVLAVGAITDCDCHPFTPDPPAVGGCKLGQGSCAKKSDGTVDETCEAIVTDYCTPLLRSSTGKVATECDVRACASSVNDQFIAAVGDASRSKLVPALNDCVSAASAASMESLLRCPLHAITELARMRLERGQIVPATALTIPGDRAQSVRCAYAQCGTVASPCFADGPDAASFAAAGIMDTCRSYRACLAECRQNISDSVRRAQCVQEQCDPRHPVGRPQFQAYRTCMIAQEPGCGSLPQ
jgi:hypothetical protein